MKIQPLNISELKGVFTTNNCRFKYSCVYNHKDYSLNMDKAWYNRFRLLTRCHLILRQMFSNSTSYLIQVSKKLSNQLNQGFIFVMLMKNPSMTGKLTKRRIPLYMNSTCRRWLCNNFGCFSGGVHLMSCWEKLLPHIKSKILFDHCQATLLLLFEWK